jgi:hypothetical protein
LARWRLKSTIGYNIFSAVYRIKQSVAANIGFPYYFHRLNKQVKNLINIVKPDIIKHFFIAFSISGFVFLI